MDSLVINKVGKPTKQEVVGYYSNQYILDRFTAIARNREVGGVYADGGYDKRPAIIQYPSDILQMVKKGIVSFHFHLNTLCHIAEHFQHQSGQWKAQLLFSVGLRH